MVGDKKGKVAGVATILKVSERRETENEQQIKHKGVGDSGTGLEGQMGSKAFYSRLTDL